MDVNLVLFKKSGSQKSIPLPSNVTVIGRRQDCDLCIPLGSVSRRHCKLLVDDKVLKIRDLGSRNKTYLNGKPVEEAEVRAGDYIEIGAVGFVLQIDGQPENPAALRPKATIRRPLDEDTAEIDGSTREEILDELGDLDELGELDDEELESL